MKCHSRKISQPEDWWAAFETYAKSEGQTLSEWLGNAGRAYLPYQAEQALSDRPAAHRPKQTN